MSGKMQSKNRKLLPYLYEKVEFTRKMMFYCCFCIAATVAGIDSAATTMRGPRTGLLSLFRHGHAALFRPRKDSRDGMLPVRAANRGAATRSCRRRGTGIWERGSHHPPATLSPNAGERPLPDGFSGQNRTFPLMVPRTPSRIRAF